MGREVSCFVGRGSWVVVRNTPVAERRTNPTTHDARPTTYEPRRTTNEPRACLCATDDSATPSVPLLADLEHLIRIAQPPVELREDLHFVETRVAGAFNPS